MTIASRCLLAAVLMLACAGVGAQTYPAKPIRIMVGSQPGGGTDIIARLVGQKLGEQLGQPVIIGNKPGADGIIATDFVAKSDADGYTLLAGTDGSMVVDTSLYSKSPYDPVKDFAPITMVVASPVVFAVHPGFAAKNMDELIALAKSKPGSLSYASGAPQFYVATELLKRQAGIDMVHIPFKGSNPAISAVTGGQLPIVVTSVPSAWAQLRSGSVRGLAVISRERYTALPDLPTLSEAGMPELELFPWTGLFAPAGTPRPVIDRLYKELAAALRSDSVRESLTGLGYEISRVGMPPADFAAFHKAEVARWTKVVRDFKIRVE